MGQIKRYFYDKECNKIENDKLATHDEIAREFIQKNQGLLAEYKKVREAGFISESVFLAMKGYVYVGELDGNLSAMISSISLSPKCDSLVRYLKEEKNCYIYDIIRSELKNEQLCQIKQWYTEGMPRKEIIDKVMTEMLVLLAPTKEEQTNKENGDDER